MTRSFVLSPKEYLQLEPPPGHDKYMKALSAEPESALSDPQLKQCVRQLQNAHRQIFNQLMALV